MKIQKLTVWHVPLTSHQIYYMGANKTADTVTSVVLQIATDDGHVGWGEVCPLPHYFAAYADGVVPALAEFADVLLGAEMNAPEAIMARLDRHLIGHDYAKSIVDMALWDLMAKSLNVPLYMLLGGLQSNRLPLYHSITCVDPAQMGEIAKLAYAGGVRQFQARLGADNNWRADVERLAVVREVVGPRALVFGDWSSSASTLTATRVAREVSGMDVMIEQPCKTIAECKQVRAATGLPMKLDEAVYDIDTMIKAHREGCLDALALKLSKFGGLSASRRARDLAVHLGIQLCIEDTWGSDITTAACLHLAASTPRQSLLNTCDLSGYVNPRIDQYAPTREQGEMIPPGAPGLGVEPEMDILGDPIAVLD